ncbi:MAG: GDP-mannose 4,6-dehydratase [Nocardioidaceae bacterium]|nr:GDP-mannose 4,6-dehydratase [Nocardioidaceae bacterium]
MRTALITGIAGQDGTYLARSLLGDGFRVVGTVRGPVPGLGHRNAYLDGVEFRCVDLLDAAAMTDLLAEVEPDEVYNLAAVSSVGLSWREPERTTAVNQQSVEVLVAALLAYRNSTGAEVRFFQASSAEVGGQSPYAQAKAAAEQVVLDARDRHGLHACFARLHVHESPLRPIGFVSRKITHGAAAIAAGRTDHLSLGNLDVVRDWGFAGDYVEAMRLMVAREVPVDLPIGTGRPHQLAEFVACAFTAAGLGAVEPYLRQDPALLRPADTPVLVADPVPAAEALGWRAQTDFTDLIAHLVRVDVARLRTGCAESPEYLFEDRAMT